MSKTKRVNILVSEEDYFKLLYSKRNKACFSVPDEIRFILGVYFEKNPINETRLEEFLVVNGLKQKQKETEKDIWD